MYQELVQHLLQDADVPALLKTIVRSPQGREYYLAAYAVAMVSCYTDDESRFAAFGTLYDLDDLVQEMFGVLLAVTKEYDPSFSLGRDTLVAFVRQSFRNRLASLYRNHQHTTKRNALLECAEELLVGDVADASYEPVRGFLGELTKRQQMIVWIRMGEVVGVDRRATQVELGKLLKCTQVEVSRDLTKIKQVFVKYAQEEVPGWDSFVRKFL